MNPLAIIEIGAKLLDKIIPDKDAREKAQAELFKAAQEQDFQLALGQIQLNTEEAKSNSIFVSGWRPYIGWVCGIALTYNFIIYPLMLWFIAVYGSDIKPPALFSDVLMELVLGMLGLGTLRTFEKWKGVTK
jgi:hypothetical protein